MVATESVEPTPRLYDSCAQLQFYSTKSKVSEFYVTYQFPGPANAGQSLSLGTAANLGFRARFTVYLHIYLHNDSIWLPSLTIIFIVHIFIIWLQIR